MLDRNYNNFCVGALSVNAGGARLVNQTMQQHKRKNFKGITALQNIRL